MDAMKATNSDYAAQIEAAQQQASEISNLIAQQDAELQRLAEERRKAEEEAARKAAEEEAARQAAAEEAERQQAAREEEARQEAAREEASREEAAEQQNHTSIVRKQRATVPAMVETVLNSRTVLPRETMILRKAVPLRKKLLPEVFPAAVLQERLS